MIKANSNEKPYLNPYIGGIGLGLVLFSTFLLIGKGLGASGALTRFYVSGLNLLLPDYASGQAYLQRYLNGPSHPLYHWLIFMFIGIVFGALFAGIRQRRMSTKMSFGPQSNQRRRIITAFLGGILVAFGARLAGGCTSGLALTGAATLGAAGWVFFLSVFAAGLVVAFIIRKEWI